MIRMTEIKRNFGVRLKISCNEDEFGELYNIMRKIQKSGFAIDPSRDFEHIGEKIVYRYESVYMNDIYEFKQCYRKCKEQVRKNNKGEKQW